MNTTVSTDHELGQYERACAGFDPLRLSESAARTELKRHWQTGVALLTGPDRAGDLPDESPRLRATMTSLATRWLRPRSPEETRDVLYERIAALRPVEQNQQLQELMEKNNEGTMTPLEYAELVGLNEFFDTLQAIIDEAITAQLPRWS